MADWPQQGVVGWDGDFTYTANFGKNAAGSISLQVAFNPTIVQGSTIQSAYVNLYASLSLSGTTVNTVIKCLAADDGGTAPYNVATNTTQWNAATSGVTWNSVSAWIKSQFYPTPDISAAIQEVVNRPGFHSGQHVIVTVRDNGSSANAYRAATTNTRLYVTYTIPVAKTISGRITIGGTGLDGVTMTYSGGLGSVDTSGGGYYSKSVPHDWSGTVTPSASGETFSPTSISYTYVQSDQSNQNYTAYVHPIMSGTVSRFGTGISGVTITVSGVGTVDTGSSGTYAKAVPYNWTGTITPAKSGETFTPTYLGHDVPTTYDESGQDFTMVMHVPPAVNIVYTNRIPEYSYGYNLQVINIVYTAYPPSRNVYSIDTNTIIYSLHEPVYEKGFVNVRKWFKLNAIGERVSLKFENADSIDLILNDLGVTVAELYRRKSEKVNIKGNRIGLKFQNNEAATSLELQYLKLFPEVYEYQIGTSLNIKGNHLSFKFQNNTASKEFELQYMKPFIETYENQ